MVSEITRSYCKPDMTSSWFLRQAALQAIFHDGFWKSDHDFRTVIHSNFLSAIHSFRDNEVLLPTGYDVIVISPLGSVSHRFCWRNLKERPQFHNRGFVYVLPFGSYSKFYFGPFRPIVEVFLGYNFTTTHSSSQRGSPLHQTASFELENLFTGMGYSSVKE